MKEFDKEWKKETFGNTNNWRQSSADGTKKQIKTTFRTFVL